MRVSGAEAFQPRHPTHGLSQNRDRSVTELLQISSTPRRKRLDAALVVQLRLTFLWGNPMNLPKNFRSILFATSAMAALAACSDATIESPGDGTPIIINPLPPSTGTGNFVSRSTAPITASDCGVGTTFMSGVETGDGQSNFCALDGGFSGAIPFSEDPLLIDGTVFVTGNLEIAAGQTFASASQPGIVDLLVVTPGATMTAVGNAGAPIIFTSMQDWVDDGMPNGTGSAPVNWGGIAINGSCTAERVHDRPVCNAGYGSLPTEW